MTQTDRDRAERTPLHYAAINRRTDRSAEVRSLLEQGADVDAVDVEGMTALHFAAMRKDTDVVRVLLEGGAQVNGRTDVAAPRSCTPRRRAPPRCAPYSRTPAATPRSPPTVASLR